jgi:hypothetical protein
MTGDVRGSGFNERDMWTTCRQEVLEIVWLASVIAGISVGCVALAVALVVI